MGAEYLVHSVPVPHGMYFAKDYLVVEIAIFPSKLGRIPVSREQFMLLINGKAQLRTQPPGMVASSIRIPEYEGPTPHPEVAVGAGGGNVILGQPAPVGRFPGDPTGTHRPGPEVPGDPNVEPAAPVSIDETVGRAALPEATVTDPVKGCLFFRYEGKLKSIHSLDLLYDGGEGAEKARLSIR